MALVTQSKGALSGGVNQQSPVHSLANQVKEMVNVLPTLDQGSRLRNSTAPINLQDLDGNLAKLTFPELKETAYVYEYDRGSFSGRPSELAFIITENGGLEIVDLTLSVTQNSDGEEVLAGTVYKDGNGINFIDNQARDYFVSILDSLQFSMTTVKDTTFVTNKLVQPKMLNTFEDPPEEPSATSLENYLQEGYIWIKRIDTSTGYKYGCAITIKDANGVDDTIDVPLTAAVPDDSNAAALALKANIDTALGARAVTTVSGSIIQIKLTDDTEEMVSIDSTDSFGDTASYGWAHNVDYQSDLPKNMGGFDAIVEVGEPRETTYWLRYDIKKWYEYHKPNIHTQIDPATMPHVIIRRYDTVTQRFEFYVERYEWGARAVGDEETNKIPTFVQDPLDTTVIYAPIRDLFFFRNRLGFITDTTIILSDVGVYGNFFRTSVAANLESDRIDAGVQSTKAVNLSYSVLLEDSVILFADKAQFRFSGGDILSSTSYKIQQEMAYDVNVQVRPLFMNDRIFFVAKRGSNSAVYEMRISNNSGQNSTATDISAHVQTYIDGQVDKLTGSSVNSMLFISSRVGYTISDSVDPLQLYRNTVFVYKYYDIGGTRNQAAWFKWTFAGDLLSAFAIGTHLYLLIDRNNAIETSDWVMGSGEWQMDNVWRMNEPWIMSPDSYKAIQQFERLAIQPKPVTLKYLDNYNTKIDGFIDLGEYVYGQDGKKKIDGSTLLKTLEVKLGTDSRIKVWTEDKRNGKYREVKSSLVIGRKPMLYGKAINTSFGFRNDDEGGFRIDEVLIEANRVRRIKGK